MVSATVKSTVNLNTYYKEQLEYLVQINELSSVTEGINLAIEQFVKEKQKELYAKQMQQAAQDQDFVKRTMGTQSEFTYADLEVDSLMCAEESEW